MVFRVLSSLLLLLAASAAYGDALNVEYQGQLPEFDVLAGEPVTYSFENTNVDDEDVDVQHHIGTGMQIRVDGVLKTPASGVFSSSDKNNDTLDDCEADDPPFSDTWKCGDLLGLVNSQEYSFTWTPPGVGAYEIDFLAFCQELPVPDPVRLCAVNGNEGGTGTAATFTTVVNPDTDGDGIGDPTDPDDDNDGILDDLDTKPLIPSNVCNESGFDNATLGIAVTEDVTCAARVSIDVLGATKVWGPLSPPAHLRLIAPTIRFEDGFKVDNGGLLSVTSANPCPGCGGYEIGDEGPAGGIVFYVTDGGYHGLEAAPEDQNPAQWCFSDTDVVGVDNISDADIPDTNSGALNTPAIVEQCGVSSAAYVAAYTYIWPNGQLDGFLPNKEELDSMYQNLHVAGFGNFASDFYWSSSEGIGNSAWAQFFVSGFQGNYLKNNSTGVRAVRAF